MTDARSPAVPTTPASAASASAAAEPAGVVDQPAGRRRETTAPKLRWWFLAVVVAAALPRLLTAGHFVTTDEPTWMNRTVRFSDAIIERDFANASASLGEPATMPGAPTMWIGSVARGLWTVADDRGLTDEESFRSLGGLGLAQHLMALSIAALIGALFVATARWAGLVPALVASAIVATEPWFVGLGAVLHTDELTALFGTLGLVMLARVLGIPDGDRRPAHPGWAAALAGVTLMAAGLTKVTGIGFWTGAVVLGTWALVRHRRAGGSWFGAGSPVRLAAIAVAAGLALVPVAWPAVVVDTTFQLERLVAAAELANERNLYGSTSARQYYLGEAVDSPGWSYYLAASALRVTPWFFLAILAAVPVAFVNRATRSRAMVFVAPVVGLLLVLSASEKTFDRYGIVFLVPLAVIAGLGTDQLLRRARLRRQARIKVVATAGAAMLVVALVTVPWGLAYFNPALGGSAVGQRAVLVGWGEGLDLAAERIRELEGGDCSDTTVAGLGTMFLLGAPCTQVPTGGIRADYVVRYINTRQRATGPDELIDGRELVDVIEVRDIPYAEIWR